MAAHAVSFVRSETWRRKGWLVHVMRCIERLGKRQFSLDEVYGFESELSNAYPGNQHVRPKNSAEIAGVT